MEVVPALCEEVHRTKSVTMLMFSPRPVWGCIAAGMLSSGLEDIPEWIPSARMETDLIEVGVATSPPTPSVSTAPGL